MRYVHHLSHLVDSFAFVYFLKHTSSPFSFSFKWTERIFHMPSSFFFMRLSYWDLIHERSNDLDYLETFVWLSQKNIGINPREIVDISWWNSNAHTHTRTNVYVCVYSKKEDMIGALIVYFSYIHSNIVTSAALSSLLSSSIPDENSSIASNGTRPRFIQSISFQHLLYMVLDVCTAHTA